MTSAFSPGIARSLPVFIRAYVAHKLSVPAHSEQKAPMSGNEILSLNTHPAPFQQAYSAPSTENKPLFLLIR